jgi:hypothetical protein
MAMILKFLSIPFLFAVGCLGIVACATFELINIFINKQ